MTNRAELVEVLRFRAKTKAPPSDNDTEYRVYIYRHDEFIHTFGTDVITPPSTSADAWYALSEGYLHGEADGIHVFAESVEYATAYIMYAVGKLGGYVPLSDDVWVAQRWSAFTNRWENFGDMHVSYAAAEKAMESILDTLVRRVTRSSLLDSLKERQ